MILNDTINLIGLLQDIYFNGKINSSTLLKADLLRIVNKYYKIAQSDIRGINEDFFGEIFSYDLQVNTGGTYPNEYVLDGTVEKIKQLQVAYNPANPAAVSYPSDFQTVNLITQDQIGDPSVQLSTDMAYATIYDNSFFLNPTPTQAVTAGIRLFGIILQTDMANDSDQPNIFPDYQDVIVWGSLIDIAVRIGKPDLFKQATGMFAARRKEMKEYASARVADLAGAYVAGQADELSGWSYSHGHNSMS